MIKNYKLDKFGLPIIGKNDFEEEIVEIIKDYNPVLLEIPQAIDIEHFVEHKLGLNIEYHTLSQDESIYGALALTNGFVKVYDEEEKNIFVIEKTILIDATFADINEGMYRFTLAHEAIGHFMFQYNYKSNKKISFEKTDSKSFAEIALSSRSTNNNHRKLVTEEDWSEWQANFAASCFLMNREVMLKFLSNILGFKVKYKDYFLEKIGIITFIKLKYIIADTFNVTLQAAQIRLFELSYD